MQEDIVDNNVTCNCFGAWAVAIALFAIILMAVALVWKLGDIKSLDIASFLDKKQADKRELKFSLLPRNIQDLYILRSRVGETTQSQTPPPIVESLVNLKDNIEVLHKQIETLEIENQELRASFEDTPQSNFILEESVAIDSKFVQTGSYIAVTCYDTEAGSRFLTKECSRKIEKFAKNNLDAIYFEVIPVVGLDEFDFVNKLEASPELMDTTEINEQDVRRLARYTKIGLGKLRSNEAGWIVRQAVKKEIKVVAVNYAMERDKSKGVVVRAYR